MWLVRALVVAQLRPALDIDADPELQAIFARGRAGETLTPGERRRIEETHGADGWRAYVLGEQDVPWAPAPLPVELALAAARLLGPRVRVDARVPYDRALERVLHAEQRRHARRIGLTARDAPDRSPANLVVGTLVLAALARRDNPLATSREHDAAAAMVAAILQRRAWVRARGRRRAPRRSGRFAAASRT